MTMNYATKWMEVKALWTNMAIVITKFLYGCILNNFGGFHIGHGPRSTFINDTITYFLDHFVLWHTTFTTCYIMVMGMLILLIR
jgi:hypothetical protein